MISLTPYEFDITKELINIALSNAADAFSLLAKERVLIKGYDFSFMDKKDNLETLLDQNHQKLNILTTDIKGKLDGKSYLLVNDRDAHKIFKVFTGSNSEPTGELSEFQQAILLELDNILTASMVTQLSNILNLFTYGDVPRLSQLSRNDTLNLFQKEINDFDVIININAKFQSYDTNMSPSFIWFFRSEFLVAIKEMVKDKKHLSLVKNN